MKCMSEHTYIHFLFLEKKDTTFRTVLNALKPIMI